MKHDLIQMILYWVIDHEYVAIFENKDDVPAVIHFDLLTVENYEYVHELRLNNHHTNQEMLVHSMLYFQVQ